MRDTLNYKAVIGGQEVVVTRYRQSDGQDFMRRIDSDGTPKRKKVRRTPVDDQLHALDMLLASAQENGENNIIVDIENSIAKRIRELTGG